MSEATIKEEVLTLQRLMDGGRLPVHYGFPVTGGGQTEAARRYSTCVILRYLYSDKDWLQDAINHMLFEDELDIDASVLDDIVTAVHLERGLFGAHQITLGNEHGQRVVLEALQELDGVKMSPSALSVCEALTNLLVRQGAVREETTEEVET